MPIKIRPIAYLRNAVLGSGGGASVNEMLFGSTTINTASATAGSTYVTTFNVSGLDATANLFVQANSGLAACTILSSACVSAAGVVSASIRTTGSATSACSVVTVSYFAVN